MVVNTGNVRVKIEPQYEGAFVVAGGFVRNGDGQARPLAVDMDGNVRLCDADIERIAQAVFRLMAPPDTQPDNEPYVSTHRNAPRRDLGY